MNALIERVLGVRSSPFEVGQLAYHRHECRDSNPYDAPDKRQMWFDGYDLAATSDALYRGWDDKLPN